MNEIKIEIQILEKKKEKLLLEKEKNILKIIECNKAITEYKALYKEILWLLVLNTHQSEIIREIVATNSNRIFNIKNITCQAVKRKKHKLEKEASKLINKGAHIQNKISIKEREKKKINTKIFYIDKELTEINNKLFIINSKKQKKLRRKRT
mgnify:CR=1 FL=1